jgi:hypothetical protein
MRAGAALRARRDERVQHRFARRNSLDGVRAAKQFVEQKQMRRGRS